MESVELALGLHPKNGYPLKIMLVDDTKVIRMILKQILLAEKFEVILEAENGQQAIELLDKSQEKPDIIFVDKEMPLMDGIATIKAIHPKYPNIKLIMFTSINDQGNVKDAIQSGVAGYIVKPDNSGSVERRDFLERVARAIGREDYCKKYINC